jgi:ATP-dependent RNA helicase SUPV3L1/SUV3
MSSIFSIVGQITHTSRHFRSIGTESFEKVGNLISQIKPLTFQERFTFGNSPVNLRDLKVVESLVNFVKSFAKGQPILMEHWGQQVGLFDKLQEIELVREQRQRQRLQGEQTTLFSPTTLQSLESFHRCLTLYLWLSYRLAPIFSDQSKARELRQDVEKSIEFVLEGIRFERVERGKGSKRNKAKFSTSTSTEQMNDRQVIR